jgi:hypothetical protein
MQFTVISVRSSIPVIHGRVPETLPVAAMYDPAMAQQAAYLLALKHGDTHAVFIRPVEAETVYEALNLAFLIENNRFAVAKA